MTRSDILSKIDNPRELEKLYQDNKTAFKMTFNLVYPELTDNRLADFWNERLNYESADISWGSRKELFFVIIASLAAGFIAKLPAMLDIDAETFYQRNIGFIIFPVLCAYCIWKQSLSTKKLVWVAIAFLVALFFINLLPADNKSDTLLLSCIHLPLFLWAVSGFVYIGGDARDYAKRLGFLRFNGDLLIMTGLLAIAGGILTALSINLFDLIGFKIEKFYTDYIVVFGLAALPIIATYITWANPQLVSRISPVIAKIFSPLVLITMVVFLVAILFSGKVDPYNNRDFLMIFNFVLIGVMAIILFSVAETFKKNENRTGGYILFALSIVTIIVNGIALSAILFRIAERGFTPNRLAVLGANILMLANLLIVSFKLFKHVSKKAAIDEVGNAIAMFLPVYIVWTVVVTFIFPWLFHFK